MAMRAAAVAAAALLVACSCVATSQGAAFDVALWRRNSTLDKNVQRSQRNVLCECLTEGEPDCWSSVLGTECRLRGSRLALGPVLVARDGFSARKALLLVSQVD